MTAELDTLRDQVNDLAAGMAAKGAQVTYRQLAGVDHGFTHAKPVDVARESLQTIGDHQRYAYAGASTEERKPAVMHHGVDGRQRAATTR